MIQRNKVIDIFNAVNHSKPLLKNITYANPVLEKIRAKSFVNTLTSGMNITHSTDRLATVSPMVKQ